jgi:hypothetical protein
MKLTTQVQTGADATSDFYGYNAKSSLVRFENKNVFFYPEKL